MSEHATGQPVPVFNCVVRVSRLADGTIVARVANLDGIESRGRSEREALGAAVAEFKAVVGRCHAAGEAIPWVVAAAPEERETERLIAVHL